MYMRKYSTPAQLTVFLSAITITFLLFVPPVNGDADNGTFFITLHGNGLYQLPNYPYIAYSHIALKYGIMQYFNSYPHPIVSTTTFFVQIAIALNKLFYSTKIFDIRFLGLTYFMFYLGALYLLTNAFTSKQKTSRDYAIALVIWFIFSDSSLTLFFNSFYLEPVHLITMLYAVGAYGLIAQRYYWRLWPMLIVYFVAVFGFIATKQQNTFFVAGWLLTAFGMFALTKTRVQKLAVAVTMVLIVGAGLFSNYCVSTKYNDENKYQSMTCGIWAESNNPEKALADGGISPQFALLRDDPYFKTYTALDVHSKYMKDNFLNKYNYLWITSYYVSHWSQFNQLLNAAAANAQNMQMYGLGNYPPHSGHPAKAQTRITLCSLR